VFKTQQIPTESKLLCDDASHSFGVGFAMCAWDVG